MKQIQKTLLIAVTGATLFVTACSKKNDDNNQPTTPAPVSVKFLVSGDSAGIVQKLNEFRLLAGDPLNVNPGATAGRREVNWDAVPANFTNNSLFPADFFGSADPALPGARKRGLIMSPSVALRVDSTLFAEVEPTYASQFQVFSKKRLFSPVGSNITEVSFNVPGSNAGAFVNGFGVIFTDVDIANATTVEYFNGQKSLGKFAAPVRTATGSFSFVGVGFPDEKVTRVRIVTGTATLGAGKKDISSGGTADLVVMDDFIYSEPKANQ